MVDLCDKGSEFEDMNNNSQSSQQSQTTTTPDRVSSDGPQIKTCLDCGTTKTPVWRGGPAGPKTLCNACGIRSRKRRRALLGLNNKEEKKTKKTTTSRKNKNGNNNKGYESTSSSADSTSMYGDTLKRKLFTFGAEVSFQRPRSNISKKRRKLGEEEEAAFLLMALSCGSVYA